MKTEVILITPDKAREMMQHNIGNRTLSKRLVAYYKEQMLRGMWLESGSPIQFSKSGRLIDGQHRLQALIEANVSIKFNVVTDLDEEVFKVLDKLKVRKLADNLKTECEIKGYEAANFTTLASAVRVARLLNNRCYDFREGRRSTKFTDIDAVNEYIAHKVDYDRATDMAVTCHRKLNFLNKSEIAGIYAYLTIYLRHDYPKVTAFFNELFFGNENTMLTSLRDRLIRDKLSKSTLSSSYRIALIAKTWNAYLTGRMLKCIKYNPDTEETVTFK